MVAVARGVIRWFNGDKGFGFIAPDDGGADLFVEHTDIDCSTAPSSKTAKRWNSTWVWVPRGATPAGYVGCE